MNKVKGLNDTFLVEGRHVRKKIVNGEIIYWIPNPWREVKAYMDQHFSPIDNRHWKEVKK